MKRRFLGDCLLNPSGTKTVLRKSRIAYTLRCRLKNCALGGFDHNLLLHTSSYSVPPVSGYSLAHCILKSLPSLGIVAHTNALSLTNC